MKEEKKPEVKHPVGRPKKKRPVGRPKKKRPVGRPKKIIPIDTTKKIDKEYKVRRKTSSDYAEEIIELYQRIDFLESQINGYRVVISYLEDQLGLRQTQ